MGFTNVHHAFELLRNAGGEQCTPAILPDFQKFVTMIGQYFEQEELDAFSEALRHPTKDVWLHRNDSKHVLFPGLADAPIDRPSVRTSSGLKKGHRPAVRRNNEPEDTTPEPALAFVLVIRGKSAALCSKVRILYTLNLAAAAMFEEAINGYSTVFTAAVLRAQVNRLSMPGMTFRKVDAISQLYASTAEEREVALLCGGERFGL